jgi:methionine--tRNA ligase beta chain
MGDVMSVSIEDFSRIEMRVGRIVSVEDIPQAKKPMYRLILDFGNNNMKQCVAGIKEFYTKEELVGKLVVAVVNLKPKSVAGVVSECMLLAAFNENTLSLIVPERNVTPGLKVS